MVELNLSEWLKADEFPASGELSVKFLDEGELVQGDYGEQFQITVELGGGVVRKWSMNKTSQRSVAGFFGSDTKSWVGQTADLFLATQMVDGKQKKVIYASQKIPEA